MDVDPIRAERIAEGLTELAHAVRATLSERTMRIWVADLSERQTSGAYRYELPAILRALKHARQKVDRMPSLRQVIGHVRSAADFEGDRQRRQVDLTDPIMTEYLRAQKMLRPRNRDRCVQGLSLDTMSLPPRRERR